jgi:hypothetical protein
MDVYGDFMDSGCKHGITWMFMEILWIPDVNME